jgi:transketolase C-terminal domain/subunit
VIPVEEYQVNVGPGSAVSEVLCDVCATPKKFLRIRLPDQHVSKVCPKG